MLRIALAACVFLVSAGTSRSSDDEAVIRKLAQQFTEARLKNDRAGMEVVLHPDYQGDRLAGRGGEDKNQMSRAEAIAAWTDPNRTFKNLAYTTQSVRVLGATAVETGDMSVWAGWKNAKGGGIYGGVRFVRVWMKDANGWRVVHEWY